MGTILQCESDIQKYKNLKTKLRTIANKLSKAAGSANNLRTNIKSNYHVDDDYTPIIARTTDLKKDMNNTSDYLIEKVIPAIDLAISNLNKEKAKLELEQIVF